jgi:hypothetical protein
MRAQTILLPDVVDDLLLAEAMRQKVGPAAICSGIIAEHFLNLSKKSAGSPQPVSSSPQPDPPRRTAPSRAFDVQKHFPDYPSASIELAQAFVDEALKIPGIKAFKAESGRGIGIEPNFVFVEYLQKSWPGGIGVSFYGSPDKHRHSGLRPGRNPNYSRSTARTLDKLKPLLAEIGRSYELKRGTQ